MVECLEQKYKSSLRHFDNWGSTLQWYNFLPDTQDIDHFFTFIYLRGRVPFDSYNIKCSHRFVSNDSNFQLLIKQNEMLMYQ